jgi:signal transduction histidine kinase
VPARSIYPRLFLPFAGLLVAALAVAWWLATTLLGRTLERRLDQQLEHAVSVLADGGIPFTSELLARMGELMRADIVVLDASGEIALSTAPVNDPGLRAALGEVSREAAPARRDLEVAGEPFRVVSHPLTAERDARYRSVAAVASLADLRAATRRAAAWLGAAGLALLALLGALGHRFAYGITAPLAQLARFAERIAGGERSERVTLQAPAEIESLAAALNRMAVRLEGYERELVEQHRLAALGEMAARVAHEIRNPLTAIQLQIELLAERAQGEARSKLQALLDEVHRLELVVSTTLAAGQPARLAVRDDDLSRIAGEVTTLVRPQLEHRHIRLETALAPVAPAPLDAARIKQVLLNLIANASDAMPDGGQLRITTEQRNGSLQLIVEDSGPGMPDADRERLAGGEAGPGRGIGLELSRELVALHRGAMHADASPALGGARLTVRIPVSATVPDIAAAISR